MRVATARARTIRRLSRHATGLLQGDQITIRWELTNVDNIGIYNITSIKYYQYDCASSATLNEVAESDVFDVVCMIDMIFQGGQEPCPVSYVDLNCDCVADIVDIVMIVNMAFRGQPPLLKYSTPCTE